MSKKERIRLLEERVAELERQIAEVRRGYWPTWTVPPIQTWPVTVTTTGTHGNCDGCSECLSWARAAR